MNQTLKEVLLVNNNKRAAIYARKSKQTEKGDSIQNQIKLCKGYLKNLGIDDVVVYKDEGFSGKNTDRPEFLKMIEDAKQNKFNILCCYKLDRVSRNVSDFSSLVDFLDKIEVSFISVNEQFDTSNAMGRAMMLICSVFSQLERETISLRVQDNMYSLAETGRWLGGFSPTGYTSERVTFIDISGKEKEYSILAPIQDELELVKLIFLNTWKFKSLSKVEKYLISNNIKTKNGKEWSKAGIKSIISNPVYVKANKEVCEYIQKNGCTVYGEPDNVHGILIYSKRKGKSGKFKDPKEWIYAISNNEGIIDPTDWLNVQRQLLINKDKAPALASNHTALLSSIIRCAKCGSYMRIAYASQYAKNNKKTFYYSCSLKNKSGKTRCDNRNINGYELDNIIIEKLKELSLDKNVIISELEAYKTKIGTTLENNEIIHIQKNITQNISMIENLLINVSMTTDKETVQILLEKISSLKKENNTLEKRIEELQMENSCKNELINNSNTFIEMLKNFALHIDDCNIDEKRSLVSSILDKILVDGDTGKVTLQFKGVEL
jgi:site-specific DNA recombinase